MKICIALICISVSIGLVWGEACKGLGDCSLTTCSHPNANHVECSKSGHCTCIHNTTAVVHSCNNIIDCINIGRCVKTDQHYHCVDLKCKCIEDSQVQFP